MVFGVDDGGGVIVSVGGGMVLSASVIVGGRVVGGTSVVVRGRVVGDTSVVVGGRLVLGITASSAVEGGMVVKVLV